MLLGSAADVPPVLLTMADFYGTLASVRCFGRQGIPVTVADPDRLALASWSRYTTSRVRCPDARNAQAFLDWLIAFGKSSPKHVLLPTSDDTAWLYSRYRDELGKHFLLQQPPVDAVYALLNKRRLHEQAQEAGLDVPRSWFPGSDNDLSRCRAEASFPLLIKPKTQILFRTRNKGVNVESAAQLEGAYRSYRSLRYESSLLEFDPAARLPMLQEFYREASNTIYNISGFAHGGQTYALRAGRKVLQWPSRLGVGLCFEEAEVDQALADGLGRMIKNVGFSGVFEAEFIIARGRSLLIDFNPRFYNQMAFDIARGFPAPLLAYHVATGGDSIHSIAPGASNLEPRGNKVFANRSTMQLMLWAHRLSGKRSSDEVEEWGRWYKTNRDRCVDAVYDHTDPFPAVFDFAGRFRRYLRHPRNFVYSLLER